MDSFPYWPNPTPQNAGAILQTGLQRGLQDLGAVFVIPEFNDTQVGLFNRMAMNLQQADAQGTKTMNGVVNGSQLFGMFQDSVTADPASQVKTG